MSNKINSARWLNVQIKRSLKMNTKKILTVSFMLATTVLIALGGFWQPAAAKSTTVRLVESQTIGLGGRGLHVTNIPVGVSQVYLDTVGRNLPSRFSHKIDMKYRAPAMEVRFQDAKGGEVGRIDALVYVYFNIARTERNLWLKSGMQEIAIWFASQETGSWEICPTYFVHQSRGNGTVGRLACLAPGSGYYVLAQGDFSQYVPDPQTTSSKVVSAATPHPTTLKVRAYIDGRSQLIIQGNRVHWHHLDFAAPGRHFDAVVSQPTDLNEANWEPIWPDVPDSENRDCNCDSSSYEGIPNLARTDQPVWLDVSQGRGEVFILQQPSAANNYTLVIEFDDNPQMGPDWYEINLGYIVGASN